MQEEIFKKAEIGQIIVRNGGLKPVYLAATETNNPSVFALAEIIFWTEQLMEHAKFIAMLTPLEELKDYRERALNLMEDIRSLNGESKNLNLDEDNIKSLNSRIPSIVSPLLDLEQEMMDKQKSGEIHSLVWNTFLDHVYREQERFMQRQEMYAKDEIEFDRDEVIDFWAQIMAEHAAFIAHLLDPSESKLFMDALKTSDRFNEIHKHHPDVDGTEDPLKTEVSMVIDFKTAALKGIQTGEIESIITPELADHVRREAILFGHELQIADKMIAEK